jgi:hypothetical protein
MQMGHDAQRWRSSRTNNQRNGYAHRQRSLDVLTTTMTMYYNKSCTNRPRHKFPKRRSSNQFWRAPAAFFRCITCSEYRASFAGQRTREVEAIDTSSYQAQSSRAPANAPGAMWNVKWDQKTNARSTGSTQLCHQIEWCIYDPFQVVYPAFRQCEARFHAPPTMRMMMREVYLSAVLERSCSWTRRSSQGFYCMWWFPAIIFI